MRTGLLPCWLALCAFLRTLFQALCFWALFSKVDKVNDTHMIASGVPEKNGDKHAPGILIEWEYNWLLCWISPITHFFVWFSDFWNILYLLKTLPLLIFALQRSQPWLWIFWTLRPDCEPLIETDQLIAFRWYSKSTQQIRSFRFKIIWSWFTKSWTYCNCSWEPAFIQGQ